MISEQRQTQLLARTFFSRMFESELMPAGLPQVQLVVSVIAFLGAPSLILPLLLMKKYVWLHSAAELRAAMAADRTMALLLAMTATAFITLVIWENIFPDRRDSRTLGVLPIRNRSFVVARLTAIVGLFSLLFLLTTALSSIAFGVLGAMTQLPEGFARVTIAHFLAVSAAEGCIFFGMLAAQCFLLIAFGPSAAHRLAVVLQIALIVTVLQMPMVLPPGQSFALTGGMPGWAATPSAALLPPLWFLSLYQSCVGAGYEGAGHLSRAAALLGILTPIAALTFYGASYARLTRLAVEGRPVPRQSVRQAGSGLVDRASRLLTSTPAGAAVCAFTLRTAVRSRQHRMLLAVWIGVALALTISAAVPVVVRLGWKAFEVPRGALLVGPLIFSVLVQTGLRSLFAIPVEVKANWAFRMAEPVRLSEALAGGAAALTVAGVLPSMLLAFASAAWLWGPVAGVKHAIFCGAVGIVLVQVLMRAADKVPFTCTYFPGAARIGKFWPFYLTAFSLITYGMADREVHLLQNPPAFAIVVGLLALTAALLWWLRRREARQLVNLRFEGESVDGLTIVSF